MPGGVHERHRGDGERADQHPDEPRFGLAEEDGECQEEGGQITGADGQHEQEAQDLRPAALGETVEALEVGPALPPIGRLGTVVGQQRGLERDDQSLGVRDLGPRVDGALPRGVGVRLGVGHDELGHRLLLGGGHGGVRLPLRAERLKPGVDRVGVAGVERAPGVQLGDHLVDGVA